MGLISIIYITDIDIYFVQLRLKKMFVAVHREHVNVTKKHRVTFALVSRDLKVTACFVIVIVHPRQLMVKIYSSIKMISLFPKGDKCQTNTTAKEIEIQAGNRFS